MSKKMKLVGIFSLLIMIAACGDDDQSKLGEAIEATKDATSEAVEAVKQDSETTNSAAADAAAVPSPQDQTPSSEQEANQATSETSVTEPSATVPSTTEPSTTGQEDPSLVDKATGVATQTIEVVKEKASEVKDGAVELGQKVGETVNKTVNKTVETVKEAIPGTTPENTQTDKPATSANEKAPAEAVETEKPATDSELNTSEVPADTDVEKPVGEKLQEKAQESANKSIDEKVSVPAKPSTEK